MSIRTLSIIAVCAGAIILAGCNRTNPVMNVEGSPITVASGKTNMEKVKGAIISAGARMGWQMKAVSDGYLVATLYQRGHMAQVDIKYTTESYNITYKDSSNLLYDGTNIHRNYNNWVNNLDRNIRAELAQL